MGFLDKAVKKLAELDTRAKETVQRIQPFPKLRERAGLAVGQYFEKHPRLATAVESYTKPYAGLLQFATGGKYEPRQLLPLPEKEDWLAKAAGTLAGYAPLYALGSEAVGALPQVAAATAKIASIPKVGGTAAKIFQGVAATPFIESMTKTGTPAQRLKGAGQETALDLGATAGMVAMGGLAKPVMKAIPSATRKLIGEQALETLSGLRKQSKTYQEFLEKFRDEIF